MVSFNLLNFLLIAGAVSALPAPQAAGAPSTAVKPTTTATIAVATGSKTVTISDATGTVQTGTSVKTSVSQTLRTQLETAGVVTSTPLLASSLTRASMSVTSKIQTATISSDFIKPTPVSNVFAQDIFAPVALDNPAGIFGTTPHQLQPLSVAQSDLSNPIQTNKFYGNLNLANQNQPVWVHPYSMWWYRGSSGYGMCVSHVEDQQKVFGKSYYINPNGICSVAMSAKEMDAGISMATSNMDQMSVDVSFTPSSRTGTMKMPLVNGMAFITSVYDNLTPRIFSTVGFAALVPVTFSGGVKYRATLYDGRVWLIYAFGNGGSSLPALTLANGVLTAAGSFSGVLQIAKVPHNDKQAEALYDKTAGTYATTLKMSGTASGTSASYTFDFRPISLLGNGLMMYALPHQRESIVSGGATSNFLQSTTMGLMQAYMGNVWTMAENNLPTNIGFLPWSPLGNLGNYSASALQAIAAAANNEMQQSFAAQTNLDSMYFSGKGLAKFALICLTIHDVLQNDALGLQCLNQLKESMALFVNNQNQWPLVYDTTWKGVVSSAGFKTGDLADFGNTWYNDHHFHYGYFVHTAAIIGHLDPSWLNSRNKAWVNALVRDVANPSSTDSAFPIFRSFDWFSGHSWSKGLFESGDGKDEESSSEDYNFSYGMKLWGKVIDDASMEARGNLMLSVMQRAMNMYMLMAPGNTVQPAAFVPNSVTGILFMNKADHTTYFSANEECIQGIHMIPLTPVSAFIRSPTFVAQEWDLHLKDLAPKLQDGWKSILYSNYAIANATASYEFFSGSTFKSDYLDGGASLTWMLTYAAGLGGAGNFQQAVSASGPSVVTSVAPAPIKSTSSSILATSSNVFKATVATTASRSSTSAKATSTKKAANAGIVSDPRWTFIVGAPILPKATTSTQAVLATPNPQANAQPATTPSSSSSSALTYSLSGSCGGAGFSVGAYVCWNNKILCPINGNTLYQPCGSACFDPSLYSCNNGNLGPFVASQAAQVSPIVPIASAAAPTSPSSPNDSPSSPAPTRPASVPAAAPAPGTSGTCGGQGYNSAQYVCYGTTLCPIMGSVATKLCGSACYDASSYSCTNGQLGPVSFSAVRATGLNVVVPNAPPSILGSSPSSGMSGSGTTKTCGSATYDTVQYSCFGEQLCPVVNGVSTLSCGGSCYLPSSYGCEAGRLKTL